MIASMRKFAQSKTFHIILWFCIGIMTLGGGGLALFLKSDQKDWLLKAYSQTMSAEKFQNIVSHIKEQQKQYRQRGVTLGHENIQKEAVRSGVSALLIDHVLKEFNFAISDQYMNQIFIQKIQYLAPQFINASGKVDVQALQQAIAPLSVADLQNDMVHEISNHLLLSLVNIAAYVPDFELQSLYNIEYAHKKYAYLTFSLEHYLAKVKNVKISDEQLERFYKQAAIADVFRSPEKRSGTVWKFSMSNFNIQVSDAEVKSYYDKNKMNRFQIAPAKVKIRRLLIKDDIDPEQAKAQIQDLAHTAQQNPDQFEILVRKFSQDPKVAQHGGLTEFFDEQDKSMDASIVEAVFNHLHQDGQISVPLKTARGYELVQRLERKNPTYTDFKVVQSTLKQELLAQKFKVRFGQDAARVAGQAKYNKDSFEKFVQRYKGIETSIPLQIKNSNHEITALFKTEQGRYGSFVHNDEGYVIFCDQVEKSKLPNLMHVKDAVLEKYMQEQAEKMMIQDLSSALDLARQEPFQTVADRYGLAVHHAKSVYQDGSIDRSPILKNKSVEQRVALMNYVGATNVALSDKNGYLFKLEEVAPINHVLFAEHKNHLRAVAQYINLYQIQDSFIASLYRNAKINNKLEIKQDLIKDTKEV